MSIMHLKVRTKNAPEFIRYFFAVRGSDGIRLRRTVIYSAKSKK